MGTAEEIAYSFGFQRGMIYMLVLIIACVCLYQWLCWREDDARYWASHSTARPPKANPAETPVTEGD